MALPTSTSAGGEGGREGGNLVGSWVCECVNLTVNMVLEEQIVTNAAIRSPSHRIAGVTMASPSPHELNNDLMYPLLYA